MRLVWTLYSSVLRAFLDANILFSAAITARGLSRAFFVLADANEELVLLTTGYAIKEASRNVQRKYPEALTTLLSLLDGIGFVPEPPPALIDRLEKSVPDPADVPILAGAIWAEADLLVTGNSKHFKELYGRYIGGCLVLRPKDAVELLLQELGD